MRLNSELKAAKALVRYAVTALRDRNFFTPTKINVGMPSIANNRPVNSAVSVDAPKGIRITDGIILIIKNIPRIWYTDFSILFPVKFRSFGLWYNATIVSVAVSSAINMGKAPFFGCP